MINLLPYQQRWVDDPSRLRIAYKARRIGFSFAESLRRSKRAVEYGVNQYLISSKERYSRQLLSMCQSHIEAMEMITGQQLIRSAKGSQITLTNGATIKALPPDPSLICGDAGDVFLDDFAHMPNAKEVWTAVKPLTYNSLGQNTDGKYEMVIYEIAIVGSRSDDEAAQTFKEIFHNAEYAGFSAHTVDIHQAIVEGFPMPPEIKQAYEIYN